MTTAEMVKIAMGLVTFFAAQIFAAWLFFRKERNRSERAMEGDRRNQLKNMRDDIGKDLVAIREDVRVVDNRHTQNYEHLRTSRPTRMEMEREIQLIRSAIETQGKSQQSLMASGFEALNLRFDEFKEYMKDIQRNGK